MVAFRMNTTLFGPPVLNEMIHIDKENIVFK